MKPEIAISQTSIRQYNIQRVVSLLESCQMLTRADIARITEISPASVTRIVSALNSLGLIEEIAQGGSGRGRKAVAIRLRADGMYTFGFHVDTEALRLCAMDFGGTVRYSNSVRLNKRPIDPEAVAECAARMIQNMPTAAANCREGAKAIGVTVSGRVDTVNGRVIRSEAFDWTNAELGFAFERRIGLPTRVENDAKACLTWEKMHRCIPDSQDLAYLYIGRAGIGFANSVGGTIVRGRSNSSGEIEESCFSSGDKLSDHLMERAILKRAQAIAPSVNSITDILVARKMNLSWARVLTEDFLSHLRTVFGVIESILDPHLIILGGDAAEAFSTLPELLPDAHYVLGDRFEESCARGAAMIAMRDAVHRRIGELPENSAGEM